MNDRVPGKRTSHPFRLSKRSIIRRQSDLDRLFSGGKRWHEAHLTLIVQPAPERRAAFVVPKRLGKAVTRNRMKRRLRELFRTRQQAIGSVGLILLAKPGLDRVPFARLEEEFERLLGRIREIT